MSDRFDIIVVGGGPSGARAALAASAQGLNVALIDEQSAIGGQVWRAKNASILSAPKTHETRAGDALRRDVLASDITHIEGARVWQIETGWTLHVLRKDVSSELTCKSLVLATGAREYVQPVPGWTTSGVLGLAGATALFKQSLTPPGKRTIVSGTGPLVFFVASEIRRLGGEVAAVVTPNSRRDWMRALPSMLGRPALLMRGAIWVADLMLAGVPIYWQRVVTDVSGDDQVRGVSIAKLDQNWARTSEDIMLAADSLCLGNGLIPNIEAAHMLGVPIRHDHALGGWIPETTEDGGTSIDRLYLCGDGTGIRGAEAAAHQGTLTGLCAAADLGHGTVNLQKQAKAKWLKSARFGMTMTALSIPRVGQAQLTTPETIVCRCENVTRATIEAELNAGAQSSNAIKSGSRAGMGPCGGKFCATAIAQLIAQQSGAPVANIPPATPRPPLRPVPLSIAAGSFDYDALPIPKPAPL
ncbi:NAD(P)/FAD-dependent oxidoreductase [Planktotalea sp.]|uniref:NAD(P)/FAD-dependent oxidoreductase n=1 Tax=Planktotalea sp. TaxID=2029877 RepID=UPI0025D02526|nr:NAD(P)/FAD-dependent oxidoreductase [Planktotalea sp.]